MTYLMQKKEEKYYTERMKDKNYIKIVSILQGIQKRKKNIQ